MFSLLLCLSAGIHPIITSSSDDKLLAVQKLGPKGAIDVINYKTSPKWGEEARKLTDDLGVDIVVEIGGITTMEQSLIAIGRRGLVSLVGFLGGVTAPVHPDTVSPVLAKSATMRYVKSKSYLVKKIILNLDCWFWLLILVGLLLRVRNSITRHLALGWMRRKLI